MKDNSDFQIIVTDINSVVPEHKMKFTCEFFGKMPENFTQKMFKDNVINCTFR